jgi:protein O-mannosyl-transferase
VPRVEKELLRSRLRNALQGPVARYGLLVLVVAFTYASSIGHGYVWDDNLIIVHNPLLAHPGNLARLFFSEDTAVGSTGYYRPVTYLSFALDRALWGTNPAGFHLTNLVLQICSVLLFYAATAALFARQRLALVAALIFALHPVAGETVNFLSGGRNTLLAACFTLLALLCHLKNRRFSALACFTVAIFSKEFALLLPVFLLGYDMRFSQEKFDYRRYIHYLAPIACYLALRSFAVQQANFLGEMNLPDALLAPYLVLRYLLNLIAPFQLKVLYDVHPGALLSVASLAVLALLAGAVYSRRKSRELLCAACWFLLFLLPVINLIPLQQAALMADRYAYFSLMGFSWGLAALCCSFGGRAATAAVIVLCAAYAGTDLQRNGIWENEARFFTRMTQDAPDRFDGYQNLGMMYYKRGEISRAVPYLTTALAKPGITQMFLVGSASVFWRENLPDLAEQALLRSLATGPPNPEPYIMLTTLYERSGKAALAQEYRGKTEALFGSLERLRQARTAALCREGDGYLARKLIIPADNVFWQAYTSNARYVPALIGMGRVSASRGDFEAAIAYLNQAIAIDPTDNRARYVLSRVLTAKYVKSRAIN